MYVTDGLLIISKFGKLKRGIHFFSCLLMFGITVTREVRGATRKDVPLVNPFESPYPISLFLVI